MLREGTEQEGKRLVRRLLIQNHFYFDCWKYTQVVESPPPGIDFGNCREEEDGLCCLGYVSFIALHMFDMFFFLLWLQKYLRLHLCIDRWCIEQLGC